MIGAKLKTLLLLLPKLKLLTTSGSMLVSVAAYALIWGWKFAIGFVVLLFIHEMGHVIALRREGVEASAPVFIPFLGALVWAKSLGGNALAEARVGLAGPVLGTIGAAACLPIAAATGSDLWRALAFTGFFLNLFNLLPVTPLDGGRAMAALAPWMWFVGLAAIVVLALAFPNPIILVIAVVGAFDVYGRWSRRRRGGDEARAYYAGARARPRARRAGLPRAHRRARGGHGRHPPAALDPLSPRGPCAPGWPGEQRCGRAAPCTDRLERAVDLVVGSGAAVHGALDRVGRPRAGDVGDEEVVEPEPATVDLAVGVERRVEVPARATRAPRFADKPPRRGASGDAGADDDGVEVRLGHPRRLSIRAWRRCMRTIARSARGCRAGARWRAGAPGR